MPADPVPQPTPAPARFGQCDETCTVDCGHCKGMPVAALRAEVARLTAELEQVRYHERIRAKVIADHQGRLIAADTAIAGLAAAEAKLALQQPVIDRIMREVAYGDALRMEPGDAQRALADIQQVARDALSSQPANPGDTHRVVSAPLISAEGASNPQPLRMKSAYTIPGLDGSWRLMGLETTNLGEDGRAALRMVRVDPGENLIFPEHPASSHT